MNPTVITNPQTWDNALTTLPHPQTLQSWAWGDFKSRWGWQPTRLLWQAEAGQPLAAAQILRRPIPRTPWSMLYIPRGPILAYENSSLVEKVLASIEAYAQREAALFIKIDPALSLALEPEQPDQPIHGQAVQHLLQKRGWCFAPQQIQFKNTVLLDLNPDEADLLAAMKSKWRYNIRLAERKGVVIQEGTSADLDTFYQMYLTTSQRDGFLIRPKAYYLDLWQQYLDQNQATLLLATVENEPVAGLILFYFQQTAWYMYGASTGKQRKLMPNHLLQWRAIQAAKNRGCTRYDMWGAPDTFAESDPMWGVYRFKLGFNGITQHGLGAYDFPVQPLKYQLYNQLLPKAVKLWRRLTL